MAGRANRACEKCKEEYELRFTGRSQISAMAVVAVLLLVASITNVPGLGGSQSGFGVAQGQPSSLYPVTVTLSTGETVFLATHTSDLADGNWIELSGGTSIKLPLPLTLAYEGLDSATYVRDGVTVTIKSSFAAGEATYPLATHYVYSKGQEITAKFCGASAIEWDYVDFKLISISSIAEARDIFTEAFQGKLATLRSKLSGATWSTTSKLDGAGDTTEKIPGQPIGNYLLVVVKEITGPPYDLYIYSATVVEVVDKTLDVTCPSYVEQGDPLKVNTGLDGLNIHGAIMIKETAYNGEIKLLSDNTVLSTAIYLNGKEFVDGAFFIENKDLSIEDMIFLLNKVKSIFGSNQLAYDIELLTGSMSISTSSLTPGKYVLLVGVYNVLGSRIVGLYQKTVTVLTPYEPEEPSPKNKPPVADAGPDQKVYVGNVTHFSGAGSHDPDGTIVSYGWTFGDGATASGVDVSHTYSEKGRYTVKLTVKDNRGAKGYDTCLVTVKEIPLPVPVLNETEELVPAGETGYVVNASAEADTTVTLNTTDQVIVTVTRYEENPYPEEMPEASVPKYIDVSVSDPDAVEWPIYVEITYTDDEIKGINEDSLGIYYWREGAWHRCSDTGVDTDRNVVWAYMTREELWGSLILIGGTPPLVTPPLPPILSDLTITPEEIELGEDVTIGFTIENIDEQSFTYIVTMQIGDLTLLIDIELGAYESKTVSRTITPDIVGDYNVWVHGLTGSFTVIVPVIPLRPAEFETSNLLVTPSEVEPGVTVNVSVTVTNIGEEFGSHTVELKLDGAVVDSESIALDGGDSATVSFTTSSEEEGIHTVKVDGLTGSFTVKAPPPPKKPLWPWIAIALAAVIVAILLYLIWRRTDWIDRLIAR